MNSYINLILDAEGAEERLQRLFQSAPEQSAADFLNSRHRSGADRAHKHSVFALCFVSGTAGPDFLSTTYLGHVLGGLLYLSGVNDRMQHPHCW
jgi:hypothetical protein